MIFIKTLKNITQITIVKILIVFDDMIPDLLNNKKFNSVVTELFIRGRKLNITLVFITQSYFAVPKTKFYTLFSYESFKQTMTLTNCI